MARDRDTLTKDGTTPFTQNQSEKDKTDRMKTTLKSAIAALNLAILAAFVFSGCESNRGGSGSGTHNMDNPRRGSTMPDSAMPNR